MKLYPELPDLSCNIAYRNIQVVCEYTGITIEMRIPKLPGFALTYQDPLAIARNALAFATKARSYLMDLEPQILAGICLSIYRHYNLFQLGDLPSAAAANQVLRQNNKKEALINAIQFSSRITAVNCIRLPKYNINTTEPYKSGAALNGYLDALGPYLGGVTELEKEALEATAQRITVHKLSKIAQNQAKLARFEIGIGDPLHSVNQNEIEFELQFKELKKEATALLPKLPKELPIKMQAILALAIRDRNLVCMDTVLRFRLIDRLKTNGAIASLRFAEILKECNNPYDLFGDTPSSSLESGLELLPKAQTKSYSIAEILAAKAGNGN